MDGMVYLVYLLGPFVLSHIASPLVIPRIHHDIIITHLFIMWTYRRGAASAGSSACLARLSIHFSAACALPPPAYFAAHLLFSCRCCGSLRSLPLPSPPRAARTYYARWRPFCACTLATALLLHLLFLMGFGLAVSPARPRSCSCLAMLPPPAAIHACTAHTAPSPL